MNRAGRASAPVLPGAEITNSALTADRRTALLPAGIAAADEPAVRARNRGAPARLRARRRADERARGDGDAERKPGAPGCSVGTPRVRHRALLHASVLNARPVRVGKRHGVMK